MISMEMMDARGFNAYVQLFIHGSYVFAALAFLVREILWLRILAICANASIATAIYFNPLGTMWDIFAWNMLFIAINGIHSAILIVERSKRRLTSDEQKLKDSTFLAIDPVLARKLMRAGKWRDLPTGNTLASEGRSLSRVLAIAEGEACVEVEDKEIARIRQGHFVGEMGFITRSQATATVRADGPMRCLEWDVPDLEKLLARNSDMRAAMYSAMGTDLASKIAGRKLAHH
ncbi:MAG: cyclic nucleotide-binding domain-containing protein [Pseudomonadota bacterium]